jgi:hypothetical protein
VKTLLLIISLFVSVTALAQSRGDVERMLSSQGVSLTQLESQGNVLLFGENTGHGRKIQFSQVQVLITRDQVVLKRDIENVSFSGQPTLDQVESIRFNGQYILKSDVAGAIYKQ